MAAPPKAADWITQVWAEKIVQEVTRCDLSDARESLEAAAREGQIRTRKISRHGPTELHAEYWEAMLIHAVLLADLDGLPDSQADFERHMTEWFENEQGKAPSVSQIRKMAGRLYAKRR